MKRNLIIPLLIKRSYRVVVFIVLLFFNVQSFGQNVIPGLSNYKNPAEKLKALKNLCDSLANIEKHGELKTVAAYSLKLVPQNDLANLALFNYFLGTSLEGLISRDSAIYYHEKSLAYAQQGNLSKRIRVAHQRLLYLYHSV